MSRNKLITHILNNIDELRSLTQGMESLDEVPAFLHSLAMTKVENLRKAFEDLSVASEAVETEPQEMMQSEEEHVDEFNVALSELNEEEGMAQFLHEEEKEEDEPAAKEVVQEPTPVLIQTPKEAEANNIEKPQSSATTNERFKTSVRSFVSPKTAEGRFVKDLKKALNLNDRFRYRKELFAGDNDKMVRAIEELDKCNSLDEALKYAAQFGWDDENPAVSDFISLLERRFSN